MRKTDHVRVAGGLAALLLATLLVLAGCGGLPAADAGLRAGWRQ